MAARAICSMTRRRFSSLVAGTIGSTLANCGNSASADDPAGGGFIDVHTHLGQTWNNTAYLSPEELLRWMDAHHVLQAVVLPLVSPEASSYPWTSRFVLEQTKPYRDRLIPFCSIDPRTSYQGGKQALVDVLKRYVDAGAKGFGEHKPGVAIDAPGSMKLYEACTDVGMPVLFHLDNERNTDKPGLPGLENALKRFPECIFIGHGPGWWASISGDITERDLSGYPKGKIATGGAIDRLMKRYSNLYADVSADSGANAFSRDPAFAREFLIRWADRTLFGTDFLSPGQAVRQFDLLGKQLGLPADVKAKIFRENTLRLLKISNAKK
jgi:predicted TIM-barrel fold metal-dependent hydrolase